VGTYPQSATSCFLLEFLQELPCQDDYSGREQPHVREFVRVRIDRGLQPKPMIVELNHSLVDGSVIRALVADR
jgi:hypothetical protein